METDKTGDLLFSADVVRGGAGLPDATGQAPGLRVSANLPTKVLAPFLRIIFLYLKLFFLVLYLPTKILDFRRVQGLIPGGCRTARGESPAERSDPDAPRDGFPYGILKEPTFCSPLSH